MKIENFEVGETYRECFDCGAVNEKCACPSYGLIEVCEVDKEKGTVTVKTITPDYTKK